MSNSLKFTLKQLLDLGIICSHKKKKRREATGKSGVISGGNQVAPSQARFTQGQGQSFPQQANQYGDPFDPNRYTYAVRLREEKDRKLIRKLQEQQQQQAFQSAVRENFRKLGGDGINEVVRGNAVDYAEPDDDIYGDMGYGREDMNGYFGQTATDEDFKTQQVGGFAEGEDAGYFSAREDFGMAPEEMQPEEGFGPEPTAKEGGFDPAAVDLPPTETARPKRVYRKVEYYRNRYEELAGSQADPYVSKNTTAAPIKKEIIKLLLNDYRELGGADPKILKSKNIDDLTDEISRMLTKKKTP